MRFESREEALQFAENNFVTEVCSAIVVYIPAAHECLFTYRSGPGSNEDRFVALNERTPYMLLGLDYKTGLLQLRAGKMERDETPAQTMTREFNEEVFGFDSEIRVQFEDKHYTGTTVPPPRYPHQRDRCLVVHHFEYIFTDPEAYVCIVGTAKSRWARRIIPGEGIETCEFMDVLSVPITVERGRSFHFPQLLRNTVRTSFRNEIIRCMQIPRECLDGNSIMDSRAFGEFLRMMTSRM